MLDDYQTQWRGAGFARIGLDYNTFFHKMDRMGLTPEQYEDMEADLRTMERGALKAMAEN